MDTKGIFIGVLLYTILFSACGIDLNENYTNSEKLALNLIKICVDSCISKYPESNSRNYVVNFEEARTLNKSAINKYLHHKNSILPTNHDDSIIITDKDGKAFMKQSMLISFIKIEPKSKGHVLVELSKLTVSKELIKLDLELEREQSGYRVTYSFARK